MHSPQPAPARSPRLPSAVALRWFEWLMASRLLRSRRSTHLSVVTALSVAGIALGVAALIVVLAVNTGFQAAFQERILASYPHLVIMQRGVDLRDYRSVAQRLRRVPSVRAVEPATYDDMMLSSARGRAGAIVRGVGSRALQALPAGAIVSSVHGGRGDRALAPIAEAPRWQAGGGGVTITSAVAAARHVLVVPSRCIHGPRQACATAAEAVSVLALPGALGGVMVVDAAGCDSPARAGGGHVYLRQADISEPLRAASRASCGLLASWEVLPGSYTLRWQHGGVQRDLAIEVPQGRTQVVIVHGDTATAVAPPPDDLPPDSAAVAVVAAGGQAVWVDGGQGQRQTAAKWLALSAPLPSIVLGEGLAKRLQVRVGEEVRAVSPMRGLERSSEGAEGSANGRFVVTAVVRTGFHDHDQRLALVDFGAAQRFLGRGDLARWVEVRVDDPILATREVDRYMAALDDSDFESLLGGAQELDRRLHALAAEPPPGLDLRAPADSAAVVDNWGSGLRTARQLQPRSQGLYRVIDWEEMNRNIFDAARLQKVAMSLFPFIIVLVAALNVVGTQAVVVHERARDIAILRAMGARRRSVAAVFLFQGLVVGLLGMAIGLAVGGLCCWLLAAVGYPLDPQVYLIDRLPVRAEPGTFVVAGVAAAVLAFAAAWFAAQRAAARPPVDALRRLD